MHAIKHHVQEKLMNCGSCCQHGHSRALEKLERAHAALWKISKAWRVADSKSCLGRVDV